MKKKLFIPFSLIVLSACSHQSDRLRSDIDFKKSQISYLQNKITQANNSISILDNQKGALRSECQSRTDSIKRFIREYPFATAYIYRFDREYPLDIIQDYLDASGDDERNKILISDILLKVYYNWDHNNDTVELARSRLRGFNERNKLSLTKIKSLMNDADTKRMEIADLTNNITAVQSEINLLNDTLKQYE